MVVRPAMKIPRYRWLLWAATLAAAVFFVVEMGAYRRGEIARLCRLAPPRVGILTARAGTLTPLHLRAAHAPEIAQQLRHFTTAMALARLAP